LHTPKISIITVTYNAAQVLEQTIRSVVKQTFTDYEYIIIDGSSTDTTVDIISRYATHLAYWHSEPDKGLYDAMNKGLKAARGEYIWFMNAGDEIYSHDTLSAIFNTYSIEADIYYGDAMFITHEGNEVGLRSEVTPHRLPAILSWQSMRYGMVVCHQSFIVKRDIAPLYNLSHWYSADVDWEIQCLKKAKNIVHTGLVLCKYLTGGFSKKHLHNSLLDRFRVMQTHFGTIATLKNHLWISVRGALFILKRKKGY
jgi:glycosyltransferase involved in cell wall biosynthesis